MRQADDFRCSPASREAPSLETCRWSTWVPVDTAVLCFVRSRTHVWLIHKKRGLGSGKVNGPGGRVHAGERTADAAIRETREETGITPVDPVEYGRLDFVFTNGYSLSATVYVANGWTGVPVETDEARPFWCPIESIPYRRMWADDEFWLPAVLAGTTVHGRFIFSDDTMLEHDVRHGRVSDLPSSSVKNE